MKYALIGRGRISVNHIKAVLNNRLESAAVCDVKPEAMEARRMGENGRKSVDEEFNWGVEGKSSWPCMRKF